MTDSVVAVAVRRRPRTDETGRYAVLYPAIAEAAYRVGATAVGLIECRSGGLAGARRSAASGSGDRNGDGGMKARDLGD